MAEANAEIKTSKNPTIQNSVDQEVIKLHKKNPDAPLSVINSHARDRVAHQLNQKRLRQELSVFRETSMVDALTQLPNYRWLKETLRISKNKAARALRESTQKKVLDDKGFFLIIFDIDRFKKINDTYGHSVGDEILKIIGQLEKRTEEPIARLGGDEFAQIINGGVNEKDVGKLIKRYKEKFEELAKKLITEEHRRQFGEPTKEFGFPSLNLSFGIAQYKKGYTEKEWMAAADMALYEAKNAGRNRAYIADAINGMEIEARELPMTS